MTVFSSFYEIIIGKKAKKVFPRLLAGVEALAGVLPPEACPEFVEGDRLQGKDPKEK